MLPCGERKHTQRFPTLANTAKPPDCTVCRGGGSEYRVRYLHSCIQLVRVLSHKIFRLLQRCENLSRSRGAGFYTKRRGGGGKRRSGSSSPSSWKYLRGHRAAHDGGKTRAATNRELHALKKHFEALIFHFVVVGSSTVPPGTIHMCFFSRLGFWISVGKGCVRLCAEWLWDGDVTTKTSLRS